MTLLAAALLQRLHHWAGNRVGDAEPAAKVFKGVAKRVERLDHVAARFGKGSNLTAQDVAELRKQTSQ